MARGFGGIALVCSFPADKRSRPTARTSAGARAKASAPFDPFQAELTTMPVAQPVKATKTLEQYQITMRPGTADILAGQPTPILGYDGRFPGPTIHATRGREVQVTQSNQAGRNLVVHLHGGVTEHASDGHPMDIVGAGTQRVYRYANVQRGATLWYHDHSHGEVAQTLYAGLAGFYIVNDPYEDALELPRGEYDVPLMIQDRSFNADGSFRYQLDLDMGFHGDTILVNGAIAPRMKVERRLYRLRLLNASNARVYGLVLGDRRETLQIAADGGLLPRPVKRTLIPLNPAERIDVVVDFRQFGAGTEVILHNPSGEATTQAVMRFDVVKGGAEEAQVPKLLSELETLPPVNAARKFVLSFQSAGTAMWQINGQGYDMNRIDCRPRLGTTELWTFVNNSPHPHPMHLHLAHFLIRSVDGRPPGPADASWKDVVAVQPGSTVVVRPYFDYYTGVFPFHCHTAEHGDNNMMGQMEVEE
ncbi:multicopper oxidase family protein [Solirubrobacter ginsenosidimutans]|uniref:Multicopper oxidase family protein n=1 Tax=Solirubrobacter ginsenosidimutans TaxID=490573 RepID=A0A9X3S0B0_9ACTN|nr:multicopper oxidase family protein [Solirubrobacter ginsenosidimutans]MDA0159842.1 multicopper oxidase family protein [Solirubrobacter ginsenosidimutans]